MMFVYLYTFVIVFTSVLSVVQFMLLCFYEAANDCGGLLISRVIFTITITLFITRWGLKKRSLDTSGAVGGVFVGLILSFSSYCFLACLITFFCTSSSATHFGYERKRKYEPNHKKGGQRNWIQVICNSGAATELALFYLMSGGVGEIPLDFEKNFTRSWLSAAVLSALSSANGDTWASEIGPVFSQGEPRLITTFRKVPIGTNGGISFAGTIFSALGGAVVGLSYFTVLAFTANTFYHTTHQAFLLIFIGAFSGLFGSILDSLIGATLQYSGIDSLTGKIVEQPGPTTKHISGVPIFNNHTVNMIMSLVSSIVVPSVAAKMFLMLT